MPKCVECGSAFGVFELKEGKCKACRRVETPPCRTCGNLFPPGDLDEGYCPPCRIRELERRRDIAEENQRQKLRDGAIDVMVTTESTSGFDVAKRLGIVSAECVFGMNIFTQLASSVTDIVGGRSTTQQGAFRNARQIVLEELKLDAAMLGADAVLATQFDYSEISGGGRSMLFLVAVGTAVKLA